MDARERFLATLLFQSPDRIPFEPGRPREKTLHRWHSEGLPESRPWFEYLTELLGIHPDPYDVELLQPGVNFRMIPTFEEKVLEHRDSHFIVQDWMGNITEISDEYDYTYIRSPKDFVTRKWHSFPVSGPEDFEQMKKRYNPDEGTRYPDDFKERLKVLKERRHPTCLNFSGPFWQMREWCGFEPLCMMFVEQPDFIREMASFWTEFISRVMAPVLEAGVVDCLLINEDMAYKEKCMISPAMTREFLAPSWKRWSREARQAGVPIIDEDSDGMVAGLIPIWIESGINCCCPMEVAAGNDIVAYRNRYGKQIAFRQGIDKRNIAKGGRVLEEELSRIFPVVQCGGFIPGCDHGVPHDISWPHFVRYAERLAECTGWL